MFLLFIPSIHILENLYLFIYFISFGCSGSSLLFVSFLWLWWAGAILCYCAWASHCSGLSCCGERALGCVGFVSWHMGSVVVAHGLGRCGACGTLWGQGLNSHALHWQEDSLSTLGMCAKGGGHKMTEKWRSAILPYSEYKCGGLEILFEIPGVIHKPVNSAAVSFISFSYKQPGLALIWLQDDFGVKKTRSHLTSPLGHLIAVSYSSPPKSCYIKSPPASTAQAKKLYLD